MKKLKEVTKKVINQYIDPVDPYSIGWPPACVAYFYQPERPASINQKQNDSISNFSKGSQLI